MHIRKSTRVPSWLAVVAATACLGGPQTREAESAPEARSQPTAPTTPPPAGKLVVWDGEEKVGGKEWASCSQKGECNVSLEVDEKGGRQGAGLKFQAEGSDWMGFGWNWHGWHPDTAGDDITAYKNLSFWIRVDAKSPALAPDPNGLQVWLSCSCKENKEDARSTAQVKLTDYVEEDLMDGEWHEVVIPLEPLLEGKGATFDRTTAWEFDLGTWAADRRQFTVYVDEIGFDNRG